MKRIREYADAHAWAVSLLILAVYFVVFAIPALRDSNSMGRGEGMSDIASLNKQLPKEIGLVISVIALIAILGWWRGAGFRELRPGGLKFAVAPAVFTGLILAVIAIVAQMEGTSVLRIAGASNLLILVIMTLLVGVFEEALFRGILFKGAATKFGPLQVVLVTAAFFGAMHLVNFFTGQPFPKTVIQIINAAIYGFVYGMLRLRIGALWPLILLHGFWDTTVATIGTTIAGLTTGSEAESDATVSASSGFDVGAFAMMLPVLLYGLFLLWRWSKWPLRNEDTTLKSANPGQGWNIG
ncbi:MAG: lysostaphin resistance A-like protein [Pirellulaceae bacterium]